MVTFNEELIPSKLSIFVIKIKSNPIVPNSLNILTFIYLDYD